LGPKGNADSTANFPRSEPSNWQDDIPSISRAEIAEVFPGDKTRSEKDVNAANRKHSKLSMGTFVLGVLVTLIILVIAVTPAHTLPFTQQENTRGVGLPMDWTHRHVIFSEAGTFQEALRNGNFVNWYRIMNDPRYAMQWIRRRRQRPEPWPKVRTSTLNGDWTVTLSGGANHGVAVDMEPAKYTWNVNASPNCTNDFVVFPINAGGALNQANLLGVNNLYDGSPTPTCSGTVPTVLFAYVIGSGAVQTSPVISFDGTKVAFVESISGGSVFHVLTIDKSGNAGCPLPPCNGTAYNSPAIPGLLNSAVNKTITMNGNVSVTRSSPFVDYNSDVAYVGDDSGHLHKFTGVFLSTPTEVTAGGWPVTVASGVILSAPVFDVTSQNVFVGGGNGILYYVRVSGSSSGTCNSGSPPCLGGSTVTVGTGAILDGPIVDSTTGYVFAAANGSTNAQLVQAPTNLSSSVTVAMGKAANDLYDGAFDNAYFSSPSTGHMYFCGNDSSGNPTLLRVGFSTAPPKINATNDGSSFSLATGTVDCTPLTEIYNGTTDYLFLGVTDHGFMGTPTCNNTTCVASFVITSSFPAAAHATLTTNLGNHGISGIIVDNVSAAPGASQIYFGNLQNQTGVQASQSALQ
jgi:hypothetical protein